MKHEDMKLPLIKPRFISWLLLFVVIFSSVIVSPVEAIDEDYYNANNILYYDPEATDGCASGGAVAVSLGGTLPAATLKQIKSIGFDAMLAKTKERYVYAEKQTKVPWQVLAAIHYREAGMNPGLSMADGEPLADKLSKDNAQMSSDPNKDAVFAAGLFIKNAKLYYKVDPSKVITADSLGKSFLAYNRGSLYIQAHNTYDKSPYVMNGFDDKHMNMSWSAGDTVSGRDSNVGALAIYSYLVGSGANSSGATDNSGCSSDGAVASSECSATKPEYGEGGNGHQLSRDELTKKYGPPGTQEKSNSLQKVDFFGKSVYVHKKVAGCLNAVVNELKTKKVSYKINDIGAFRTDVGGGNVANGSSYHQYGVAIDINPDQNPCCSVGKYDMPKVYIDAFHNHGWSWGGGWRSLKDYMHFEYNGPDQGGS